MADIPNARRYRQGANINARLAAPRAEPRIATAPRRAPEPAPAADGRIALAVLVGLAAVICLLSGWPWLGLIGLGGAALLLGWAVD